MINKKIIRLSRVIDLIDDRITILDETIEIKEKIIESHKQNINTNLSESSFKEATKITEEVRKYVEMKNYLRHLMRDILKIYAVRK